MTIESLPREIISQILFHLPPEQLPLLRCVSKLWNQVIDNPIFINEVCRSHFSKLPKVLDKTVWKKFHASYQWLSSKAPRAQSVEQLPIEFVYSFVKCKEGLVIAGGNDLYFKQSGADEWKRRQFDRTFAEINFGAHRTGYFYSYRACNELSYNNIYIQKWTNDSDCYSIFGSDVREVTFFKVFNDDLFINVRRRNTNLIGMPVDTLEQWDVNYEQCNATFVSYNTDCYYTSLCCNQTYLAAANDSIFLWDLRKPNAVINNFGLQSFCRTEEMNLQGNYLLESRSDRINFWDLRSLKSPVKMWNNRSSHSHVRIDSAAFLIGAADTGIVEFWSLSDLQKKQEWQLCPLDRIIYLVKFPLIEIQWEGNHLDALVNEGFSLYNEPETVLKTYIV